MRKKFLSFCGKWFEPFVLEDDNDKPEKFRFSFGNGGGFKVDEPKSCVILRMYSTRQHKNVQMTRDLGDRVVVGGEMPPDAKAL